MQVQLNKSTMHLEDTPLDIGYASEQVTLTKEDGQAYTIAGQNGKTQLIISTPFIDESFITELKEISAFIPREDEQEITVSLVVANDTHQNPECDDIAFLIDTQGEFGDWYGLRLVGDPLEGELTKSAILITKDGALFYDDYPSDLADKFNQDTLYRKITAAQTCYTGKGCH